ncbi:MAG: hypothetical protein HY702_00870 [Gemmatimonadetes bacterium]|nr:hypothetical protein [Gemmatimonadota bacterium]
MKRVARGRMCLWALAVVACGGGVPEAADVPAPDSPRARSERGRILVPVGYGTLRQDAFTVALRDDELQVKVTPLVEEAIRLAAPDTYQRLRDIRDTNRARLMEAAMRAGIREEPLFFLVSFFTFALQSEYTPTDLQIVSQGRLYRGIDYVPLTPGFGSQLLRQEETQIAVYAFDPAIDLDIPLTVQYGVVRSEAWSAIIAVLEAERGRVLSRVKEPGEN